MTCQELAMFLMSYLDDELPEIERGLFEEHLTVCPDCVAYLRTYQETVRLGKAVCTCNSAIPAAVPEELVQAILAIRDHRSSL